MFKNTPNTNNYEAQHSMWGDVVRFLCGAIKTGFSVKEDADFQSDNQSVLGNSDLLTVVRRLGRTEERYSDEIKIYKMILSARDAVIPPPSRPTIPLQHTLQQMQQLYIPTYYDYKSELQWLTDSIPYFVAIKFGRKEGVDWILGKLGIKVED